MNKYTNYGPFLTINKRNICIAISDPLQRRVHKLIPQSGELMMMDNSNVDNSDTKIVHLMCLSSAGGLPLATLVTTRKDKVLSYLSPYCQHMHSMDGVQVSSSCHNR